MEPDAPPPPALVRTSLARRVFNYPLVQALIGGAMILSAIVAVSALGGLLGIVDGTGFLLLGVLVALSVVLAWKAYKRWIEREPDREFALAGALPELAAGAACCFARSRKSPEAGSLWG
jgi:hypothetical protein